MSLLDFGDEVETMRPFLQGEEKEVVGVIVCVDYADILALTLPYIAPQLDRIVVVTAPRDTATKRVCEFNYVECVETESFYEDGAKFNKGKGINAGLARLAEMGYASNPSSWVIHLDADILVPPRSISILRKKLLDPTAIYGCDRLMVYGQNNIFELLSNPVSPYPFNGLGGAGNITPLFDDLHLGARISKLDNSETEHTFGWLPIGFVQLWNFNRVATYPTNHSAADRTDCLHSLNPKFASRQLLPEMLVFHLDTQESWDEAEMGINWEGRRTKLVTDND